VNTHTATIPWNEPLPRIGHECETPDGKYIVRYVNIFTRQIKAEHVPRLQNDGDRKGAEP